MRYAHAHSHSSTKHTHRYSDSDKEFFRPYYEETYTEEMLTAHEEHLEACKVCVRACVLVCVCIHEEHPEACKVLQIHTHTHTHTHTNTHTYIRCG